MTTCETEIAARKRWRSARWWIAAERASVERRGAWRATSAVFSVYLFAFVVLARSRLAGLPDADRAVLGGRSRETLVSGGIVANLLLQPLNVTGILFPPQAGVFLVGLLLVLLTSIAIFVRIVFIRPCFKGTVA